MTHPPHQPPAGLSTARFVLLVCAVTAGLCALGGAVAVAALSSGASSGPPSGSLPPSSGPAPRTSSPAPRPSPTGSAPARHATVGQPARVGALEFVVRGVECGRATVSGFLLTTTAHGQFCLVTMSVKNVGTATCTFDGSGQQAIGTDGVTYGDDSVAELYANQGAQTILDDINPGKEISGLLVFDIARTAGIARLQLRDSPFSDGVTVDVG